MYLIKGTVYFRQHRRRQNIASLTAWGGRFCLYKPVSPSDVQPHSLHPNNAQHNNNSTTSTLKTTFGHTINTKTEPINMSDYKPTGMVPMPTQKLPPSPLFPNPFPCLLYKTLHQCGRN